MAARDPEQGFAYYLAWGTTMQGWAQVAPGQAEAGLAQIRRGLAALRATGAALRLPYYLALLAEARRQAGRAAEGLTLLAEALTQANKAGESWTEAELHRLKGERLLHAACGRSQSPSPPLCGRSESSRFPAPTQSRRVRHAELTAEECFQQVLAVARHQQAKSWELRAAMSLRRLWQQHGKRAAARALLAPIYGWFTKGFDTADLQEAKALLEELSGHSRG
jgi:predicted ATPase